MYEDYHAQYAAKLVSVDEALSHIHDGDVISYNGETVKVSK